MLKALFMLLIFSLNSEAKTLYLGDSHSVGCFGDSLRAHLQSQNKVDFYASCGSSTTTWLQSSGPRTTCGAKKCLSPTACESSSQAQYPSFNSILSASSPHQVVIALGSNMLKAPWQKTEAEVQKIIEGITARNAECIWIGPPQPQDKFISFERYQAYDLNLKRTIESLNCKYLSSREATDRNTITDPMGLHYNCRQGQAWAQKIIELWPASSKTLVPKAATKAVQ